MSAAQTLIETLWWLPFVALLCAAGCITAGLVHVYRALWLWWYRETPISDSVLAEAFDGVKPPPYGTYATIWFAAGIVLTGLAAMLWH